MCSSDLGPLFLLQAEFCSLSSKERHHLRPTTAGSGKQQGLFLVAGILADAYQFSGEELRRRRTESVQNVRKTNGCISLEQRVRETWEDGDEWQD